MKQKVIFFCSCFILITLLLSSCKDKNKYQQGVEATLRIDSSWFKNQNYFLRIKVDPYAYTTDVEGIGICYSSVSELPSIENSEVKFFNNWYDAEVIGSFRGAAEKTTSVRPFIKVADYVFYGDVLSFYFYRYWYPVESNFNYKDNHPKVEIINENDIRVLCKGDQFRSTDKGLTFFPVTGNLPEESIIYVRFFNTEQAVLITDNADNPHYISNDGGFNWSSAPFLATSGDINAAAFYSPDKGYVAVQNKRIRATSDGGETWTSTVVSILDSDQLVKFYFVNENVTFVFSKSGRIFRTMNAGLTWDMMNTGGTIIGLTDIYFFDENHGFIISQGNIRETWNGGATSNLIFSDSDCLLDQITFIDDKNGFAIGAEDDAGAAVTFDRGIHWTITNLTGYTLASDFVEFDVFSKELGITIRNTEFSHFRYADK